MADQPLAHREGGVWHWRVPGHPLARRDGWAVAARVVLHDELAGRGVTRPVCAGCGRRVDWQRGPLRARTARGTRPLVVWYVDGNMDNLDAENLQSACLRCVHRKLRPDPGPRDDRGRFVRGGRGRR